MASSSPSYKESDRLRVDKSFKQTSEKVKAIISITTVTRNSARARQQSPQRDVKVRVEQPNNENSSDTFCTKEMLLLTKEFPFIPTPILNPPAKSIPDEGSKTFPSTKRVKELNDDNITTAAPPIELPSKLNYYHAVQRYVEQLEQEFAKFKSPRRCNLFYKRWEEDSNSYPVGSSDLPSLNRNTAGDSMVHRDDRTNHYVVKCSQLVAQLFFAYLYLVKWLNSYAQNQLLSQNEELQEPQTAHSANSNRVVLGQSAGGLDTGTELIQRCIIIKKDHKGYGLTVSGDNPVYVQSVRKDGAADRAGVHEGDRIIKVNGNLVTHANHLEVVRLIKAASYVALTLFGRPPGKSTTSSSANTNNTPKQPKLSGAEFCSITKFDDSSSSNSTTTTPNRMANEVQHSPSYHPAATVGCLADRDSGVLGGATNHSTPFQNAQQHELPGSRAQSSSLNQRRPLLNDPYKCQAIGEKINTLKNLFNQEAIILKNLQKQYLYNPSYKLKQEINSVTRRLSALNENISNLSKMVHAFISSPVPDDEQRIFSKVPPSHSYSFDEDALSCPTNNARLPRSGNFSESSIGQAAGRVANRKELIHSWPVTGIANNYKGFEQEATNHFEQNVGSSQPNQQLQYRETVGCGDRRSASDLLHRRSTGSVSSLLESSSIPASQPRPDLGVNEQALYKEAGPLIPNGSPLCESIGGVGVGSVTVLNNIYNSSATLLKRGESKAKLQPGSVGGLDWDKRLAGLKPLHSSIPNLNSASHFYDSSHQINALSIEDDDTQSDNENLEDHGAFNDIHSLKNHPAHLAVFLNYLFCNSDPNSLLFYLITDYYMHCGMGKDLRRWAYEIHSSFIIPNAPLRVGVPDFVINSIDESLQNDYDKEEVMKFLFRPARKHILVDIREKLSDFRLKRTLGLSSIYGDSPALDDASNDKSKMLKFAEQIMTSIVDKLLKYWKEDNSFEALTVARQMGIKSSTLGSTNIIPTLYERIPLFCAKEKSRFKFVTSKKPKERNLKGHTFNLYHYTALTFCNMCHDVLWGIGTQGYQCTNCEYNSHKQCVDRIEESCVGLTRRREKKLSNSGAGAGDRNSLSTKSSFMNNIIKRKTDAGKSLVLSQGSTIATAQQVSLPAYPPSQYAIEKAKRLMLEDNASDEPDASSHQGHTFIGAIREDSFEEEDEQHQHSNSSDAKDMANAKATCQIIVSEPSQPSLSPVVKSGSFSSSTSKQPSPETKTTAGVPGAHRLPYIRSFNYHPPSTTTTTTTACSSSNFVSNPAVSFFQRHTQQYQGAGQGWFASRSDSAAAAASSKAAKQEAGGKNSIVGRSESMKAKGENKYPRKKSDPNVPRSKSDISHKAASTEQVTELPDIPQPSVARVLIKRSFEEALSGVNKRSVPKSDSLLSHSSATSNQSSSTFPYLDFGSDFYDSDLDIEPEVPNWQKKIDWEHLKKMKPKEVMRQDVINELFHTEKNHVRNLKVLDYIFYQPLKRENLIPVELLNSLFPNLDELLRIHGELNEQMKAKKAQGVIIDSVGPMLLSFFGGESGEVFQKACATFCQNQSFALESLKAKQKKDGKLAAFLGEAEGNFLCRRLQLKDLVPCQMQRLTKYPLLIENIMKYTAPDTLEHNELSLAYKSARLILEHVNESVRETENFHRLLSVESKLDKSPLEKALERAHDPRAVELRHLDLTKKKLVMDGPLVWRFSRAKNIEVHALLLEDLLLIMQKQDDKFVLKFQATVLAPGKEDTKLSHSPVIKLNNLLTKNVATDKRAFFLVSTLSEGPQLYELIASTSNERKIWLKNIDKTIEKLKFAQSGAVAKNVSEDRITVARHSSNPDTKSEIASVGNVNEKVEGKEKIGEHETTGAALLKESASQPLIKSKLENRDEAEIGPPDLNSEATEPGDVDESLEEDSQEEKVEYIKTAQIVMPSEVVISEPMACQRAEPILTLYEQLKRADHLLARALRRKQNIIQDILLEKLEERRRQQLNPLPIPTPLIQIPQDPILSEDDPKSILLSALQQARKLERFVAQFESMCEIETPLPDQLETVKPEARGFEFGRSNSDSLEEGHCNQRHHHRVMGEMRDALLIISTHLNFELSRLMELFCERERAQDYADILELATTATSHSPLAHNAVREKLQIGQDHFIGEENEQGETSLVTPLTLADAVIKLEQPQTGELKCDLCPIEFEGAIISTAHPPVFLQDQTPPTNLDSSKPNEPFFSGDEDESSTDTLLNHHSREIGHAITDDITPTPATREENGNLEDHAKPKQRNHKSQLASNIPQSQPSEPLKSS